MPSTYDSTFWHQRALETYELSEQMKELRTKEDMKKLGRRYEQIGIRSAYDESRIAFESAREALRVSQGAGSREQISSLTSTVDNAFDEMRRARDVMEVFRSVHLLIVDGVDVLDNDDVAASAR
jgi:hypothetical protein